jgi:hypothetical protein
LTQVSGPRSTVVIQFPFTNFTILSCFPNAGNVEQFYEAHAGRQGIAVLAFSTNSVQVVEAQYRRFHPKLVRYSQDCGSAKVLEVYAYYKGDTSESDVDMGTVLRFVQPIGDQGACLLPGISPLAAHFDDDSQAAYCDHWVSNGRTVPFFDKRHELSLTPIPFSFSTVYSRTGFLKTLEETLGFNPKVGKEHSIQVNILSSVTDDCVG